MEREIKEREGWKIGEHVIVCLFVVSFYILIKKQIKIHKNKR